MEIVGVVAKTQAEGLCYQQSGLSPGLPQWHQTFYAFSANLSEINKL